MTRGSLLKLLPALMNDLTTSALFVIITALLVGAERPEPVFPSAGSQEQTGLNQNHSTSLSLFPLLDPDAPDHLCLHTCTLQLRIPPSRPP